MLGNAVGDKVVALARRLAAMDFVDAVDMFGGDDGDTCSDEADEADSPAVSDVAPVAVRSGDEKDLPPKEEPAAVAVDLAISWMR